MSYTLPPPPPDTPRTNAEEYSSPPDQHGQICGLVRADFARELERELAAALKQLEEADDAALDALEELPE